MSTIRPNDHGAGDGAFLLVRKGYDRAAVDAYTRDVQTQVHQLEQHLDALAADNHRLQNALYDAQQRSGQADFTNLGGRAQEILRIAEEQARDTTQRAATEADELTVRTETEIVRMRDDAARDLAQVRTLELADLEALRLAGQRDAALERERATVEATQLLDAARIQADAVRAEAEAGAHGLLEDAGLEAQAKLAAADQQAGEVGRAVAEQQERTLAELRRAQSTAHEAVRVMLADATDQQTRASAHLAEETERSATVRRSALAEAEQTKLDAAAEAEAIISRAQQQAATIDERARQEFTWRRRQMRQEQDLLARRKQAMLSQLTSLSALAVETAGSLPELPEISFSDYDDAPDADPGTDEQSSGAEPSTAQTETVDVDDDQTAVRQYTDVRR